jgi:hypothetical protein
MINSFKINLNCSFDNYIPRGFFIIEISKNKSTHCFGCDNITKNIILLYGMRHKGSFEKKSMLHGYHFLRKPLVFVLIFKCENSLREFFFPMLAKYPKTIGYHSGILI